MEAEEEAEEEGERRDTPNLGKPVCRLWREQQRDWAIAVVFDLTRFTKKITEDGS